MADQPDMAFLPKMAEIAAACSVLSRSPNAVRMFCMVAYRSTFPSELVWIATPYLSIAAAI